MKKIYSLIILLVLGSTSVVLQSCFPDDEEMENSHVADLSQIESVELKPQNLYLLANGKAKLDLTPRINIRIGGKTSPMLYDRVKDEWLEYITPSGENVSRFYTTSNTGIIGTTLNIKVKIKGTEFESNTIAVNIVEDKCKDLKDITLPVIFHVFREEGQEAQTGISYKKQLFDEVVDKWNMVFAGKITDNPVGADTHIRFKMAAFDNNGSKLDEAGIHRINLPVGIFDSRTNIYTLIEKYDALWPSDKYLNVWIDDNGKQEANDMASSMCYPVYSGPNPLPGIAQQNPYARFMPGISDGIVFKANQIKQPNKKYDTFWGYKPGYNEMIHYLGIYLGLIDNNDFGNPMQGKPNKDGVTYCPDTPVYHKAKEFYNDNTGTYKENEKCFWWSENIMDDPMGFHTSVSQDQALRMRWVLEHCSNRSSWKSSFAFTGNE